MNPWTGEQRSEQWQYSNHGDIEWSSMGGNYDYGQYNGSNASFNRALTHTDEQGQLSYDANGNIEAIADAQVAWTSFNKPLQVNEAQAITEKLYGPDRERFVTVERKDGKVTTTISIGGLFEAVSHADGSVEERFHIRAGAEHVAVYSRHQERAGVQYLHAGRQGSVDAVTNERGELVARYHYGPFGERQNPPISDLTDQLIGETEYGYTGHREMAGGSIIDMGGRIYSPALSRFLSPDPYVTEPHRTVNYNRYSYVYNNPLRYTDPSGYWVDDFVDGLTRPFQGVGNFLGDAATEINQSIDSFLADVQEYAEQEEIMIEFNAGYGGGDGFHYSDTTLSNSDIRGAREQYLEQHGVPSPYQGVSLQAIYTVANQLFFGAWDFVVGWGGPQGAINSSMRGVSGDGTNTFGDEPFFAKGMYRTAVNISETIGLGVDFESGTFYVLGDAGKVHVYDYKFWGLGVGAKRLPGGAKQRVQGSTGWEIGSIYVNHNTRLSGKSMVLQLDATVGGGVSFQSSLNGSTISWSQGPQMGMAIGSGAGTAWMEYSYSMRLHEAPGSVQERLGD